MQMVADRMIAKEAVREFFEREQRKARTGWTYVGGVVAAIGAAVLIGALIVLMTGCRSLNATVYNTENTAVDTVTAGVRGFNTYYVGQTNGATAEQLSDLNRKRDSLYEATKGFGLAVAEVDALRRAYQTNSAVQPQLEAALTALTGQSSNIVNLVQHFTK